MKKAIFILGLLALVSCEKETKEDLVQNPPVEQEPIPSTVQLYFTEFMYQTFYCIFDYTDVDGVVHENSYQMDKTVENVDFSKPFSVRAQAGLTTYPGAGQPPQQNPIAVSWQLKRDGFVIDAQQVVTYVYEN
jgi:hypothetical protein